MFDKMNVTPLTFLNTLVGVMTKTGDLTATGGSLAEYTRALRVEPIVLLDQTTQHLPYIEDVLKTCLTLFSAYYLQAVAISVNVGKVDVIKLFDHLNPERQSKGNLNISFETAVLLNPLNYRKGLPDITGMNISTESNIDQTAINKIVKLQQAARQVDDVRKNVDVEYNEKEDRYDFKLKGAKDTAAVGVTTKDVTGSRIDKKGYEVLQNPDLVVGNILDVHIESEKHRAVLPITVRLIPSIIRSDVLALILSKNERDLSLFERANELMSGQITFWRDLVMCQDLIDEHRKTLLKDKTGQYSEIMKRRQNNRVAAWITGKKSVADASNIVIMSESTSVQFEAACGGRLKDFKTRQRVFESTYLMLLIVIDTEWEQATIYHRGIALPTQVSVKSMKSNNKKGVDVGEVLKAYQLGNNPTF